MNTEITASTSILERTMDILLKDWEVLKCRIEELSCRLTPVLEQASPREVNNAKNPPENTAPHIVDLAKLDKEINEVLSLLVDVTSRLST